MLTSCFLSVFAHSLGFLVRCGFIIWNYLDVLVNTIFPHSSSWLSFRCVIIWNHLYFCSSWIQVCQPMGKDSKAKDSSKGKGKQAASGSDENASKGKGKGGKGADGLGTCTYVKGFFFCILRRPLFVGAFWLFEICYNLSLSSSFLCYLHVRVSGLDLFQQGISYVRNKGRLTKHTRSFKMVGLAMETRSHQLSLQR